MKGEKTVSDEARDIGGKPLREYPSVIVEGYAVGPWTPSNEHGLPPFTEVHFVLVPYQDVDSIIPRVVMRMKSAGAVDRLIAQLWEARCVTFGPGRRPI